MAKHGETRPRRLTARGVVTRTRIVEVAADLIYARGVGGTSLDDVMAASGTSKSQLYHYFADKEALICEVVALQTSRVLAVQQPDLHQLDSLEGLRRWAAGIVEMTRLKGVVGGCPVGSLAAEMADKSENVRELLAQSFEEWESYLVVGFQAMQDRGELGSGTDPRSMATAIMSALQGGLLLSQTSRKIRPLELALEMALKHVENHRVNCV